MRARRHLIRGLALLAVPAAMGFLHHIDRPRIIASATTPDGVEMHLVQEFNRSPEWFTTSFVYRTPPGRWHWFYYDHQDSYWHGGDVSLDISEAKALFYRGRAPAVTFRWDSETYTLHRMQRTLTGAQARMPDGWSPLRSVYARGKEDRK